jgi:hypothetical protein
VIKEERVVRNAFFRGISKVERIVPNAFSTAFLSKRVGDNTLHLGFEKSG